VPDDRVRWLHSRRPIASSRPAVSTAALVIFLLYTGARPARRYGWIGATSTLHGRMCLPQDEERRGRGVPLHQRVVTTTRQPHVSEDEVFRDRTACRTTAPTRKLTTTPPPAPALLRIHGACRRPRSRTFTMPPYPGPLGTIGQTASRRPQASRRLEIRPHGVRYATPMWTAQAPIDRLPGGNLGETKVTRRKPHEAQCVNLDAYALGKGEVDSQSCPQTRKKYRQIRDI